ncbi:hypothetical protein ACSFBI_09630 [Variovorax sp. RB3P1]|uniref:hypothetical protein n=1 Tax=Variovorax sp. RB3P1 TaxID=3443732 RepID=UPI003F46402A
MSSRIAGFRAAEFVIPRRRPAPQSGLMTWKKLVQLIREGFGQGHLHDYKPWLRVTKKDYSPSSFIGHLPSPATGHKHHYRATAERSMLLLLKWLGATDARDQYPAWPWDHNHAICGLPGTELIRVRGLMDIANDLGVEHGLYVGTDVPYVATIDILATWQHADGNYYLTAHDCKPEKLMRQDDDFSRLKQRLALIHRYCEESSIRYCLTHAERLSPELLRSLDVLHPLLTQDAMAALRQSHLYQTVVDACMRRAYERPIYTVLTELAARLVLDFEACKQALAAAIWFQDLDHDVSQPLETWHPLIPGGRKLRSELFASWVGVAR